MITTVDNTICFKPQRIKRTATFIVKADIESVFPLFGPVKEKLWAAGWDPEIIYSVSNDVEQYMIFKTTSSYGEQEPYRWVISRYEPDDFLIEYTVSTSERIWFITVSCLPAGIQTNVSVTYSYTGLTANGNRINEIALQKMYAYKLEDWCEAIHYYLETGKQKQ